MRRVAPVLTLTALLPLTGSAIAMDSAGYKLEWFTPATGSGGEASSSNHSVSFTVGQSAIGASSSGSHEGCLGYWCRDLLENRCYLPLVLRNAH